MRNFQCKNAPIFLLYILLTRRTDTFWSEGIDTYWYRGIEVNQQYSQGFSMHNVLCQTVPK